ncbi:MAG: orotidine 5'-phosphate decarboxylase / HUMPS family protein, partial [Candidatus Sulfotelmatobacter sp.]
MQTTLPHLIPGSEQQNSLVADSQKNDLRRKLIVALDVSTAAAAHEIVAAIGDSAFTYKVGMQLYTAEG